MRHRVLLADDHALVLEGLTKQLNESDALYVVASTTKEEEIWELFVKNHPDLCVIDIEMGHTDGIEIAKKIKDYRPDTMTALLTMHTSPWILARAQSISPNAILLKSSPCCDIIEALTQVIETGSYTHPMVGRILRSNSMELEHFSSLSEREIEVLQLISQGLTTRDIATQLNLSENTIETYRKNLFIKFEAPNMAFLVKRASDLGII